MTNSFTDIAKVFANTLKFLLQKCEQFYNAKATHMFICSKNINVFTIFQGRNFNVTFANHLSF